MEEMYTQMVKDCRRRDREAMRRLYETTAPMALGVCMRYCHNRETAQDLMQEGYIKVFEHIGRLREPEKLMAWVRQLMVNECLNHLRSHKETVSLEELDEEPAVPPADPFTVEEVVRALQGLPERQRMVFNLLEVEGVAPKKVARRLKTNEQNVKVLFSRACNRLQEILKNEKD
ncbi:MAG: sigma-70 family RNA polymerase sigma factor [Bacteroidales bacterium]|nr:sigma-70 family RNA polymerase sigma factor [Bacteroidales bacterium]